MASQQKPRAGLLSSADQAAIGQFRSKNNANQREPHSSCPDEQSMHHATVDLLLSANIAIFWIGRTSLCFLAWQAGTRTPANQGDPHDHSVSELSVFGQDPQFCRGQSPQREVPKVSISL